MLDNEDASKFTSDGDAAVCSKPCLVGHSLLITLERDGSFSSNKPRLPNMQRPLLRLVRFQASSDGFVIRFSILMTFVQTVRQ